MTSKTPRRLVVGISGASGTIYGVRLLELLKDTDIETHLVMSKSAEMTLVYETDYKPKDVRVLAKVNHPMADIGASISSGSFATMGMIVIPCFCAPDAFNRDPGSGSGSSPAPGNRGHYGYGLSLAGSRACRASDAENGRGRTVGGNARRCRGLGGRGLYRRGRDPEALESEGNGR